MNLRSLLASLVAALAVSVTATPSRAAPVLLDRVVATVDSLHIYRSDVMRRARPHLAQIRQSAPVDQQKKVVAEMLRELVTKMVDEALVAVECERLHLSVETQEVDRGLDFIAQENKVDRAAILAEAARQGLSEKDYREEIRRQILRAKWERQLTKPRADELARLRRDTVVEVRW